MSFEELKLVYWLTAGGKIISSCTKKKTEIKSKIANQ